MTTFTDPGIIPREQFDKDADTLAPRLNTPAASRNNSLDNDPLLTSNHRPRNVEWIALVGEHELPVSRCRTCHVLRPPRSFHCTDCGACIEVHDHHCPWVGTCVGKRNHKYFLMFGASTSILALLTGLLDLFIIILSLYPAA